MNPGHIVNHVAVIGLSHWQRIQQEFNDPLTPKISLPVYVEYRGTTTQSCTILCPEIRSYIDENGDRYSDNVLRDFVRSFSLELRYPGTIVHTVNIGEDFGLNSSNLSQVELNYNCNNRHFIKQMNFKNGR